MSTSDQELRGHADAISAQWKRQLSDGSTPGELVDYLYDHGFRVNKLLAIKVLHDAASLPLNECVWAIEHGWALRDAPQDYQAMRAAGRPAEEIRAHLRRQALSDDEIRRIMQ